MLKPIIVALVTLAVADICSAVILIPTSTFSEKMMSYPLRNLPTSKELNKVTYGYSKDWHLYEKVVKRSFMLALKAEADSYAQKKGCSKGVQKGLLRLNREFFRYHVYMVLDTLKFYKDKIPNVPESSEELHTYIDDMTKKCAKALDLDRAYSYAISHNMPICGNTCWERVKTLPEHIQAVRTGRRSRMG